MISFISTVLRHSIFCFFGALIRYFLDIWKFRKTAKKIRFKEYHNYSEKPDVEMLDAIVGSIVCGILLILIMNIVRRNGW